MAGQFPEYGLMALGGMLCMITGGIDLSVVGTANMASILTVFTLTRLFGADGTMPLAFSVVIEMCIRDSFRMPGWQLRIIWHLV